MGIPAIKHWVQNNFKVFITFTGVSDNLVGTGLLISIDQEQRSKTLTLCKNKCLGEKCILICLDICIYRAIYKK